jgi:hypothetical protein
MMKFGLSVLDATLVSLVRLRGGRFECKYRKPITRVKSVTPPLEKP